MYLPTVCTWQDVTLQLITLCAMATQTQLLVYVTTQLPLASLQNKCTHPSCPVTVLLRKHKIYQKTQIAKPAVCCSEVIPILHRSALQQGGSSTMSEPQKQSHEIASVIRIIDYLS